MRAQKQGSSTTVKAIECDQTIGIGDKELFEAVRAQPISTISIGC